MKHFLAIKGFKTTNSLIPGNSFETTKSSECRAVFVQYTSNTRDSKNSR